MKKHKVTIIVETNDNDDSVHDLEFMYLKIHNDFQINDTYANVTSGKVEEMH